MSVEHEIKIWPAYFDAIESGRKPFEVRFNDRDFQVDDVLHLREFDPTESSYSGRECRRRISCILTDERFGIQTGACVLGLDQGVAELEAEVARLVDLLNAPELVDFAGGVVREAAHQRERWAADHDAGKQPQDWFWLLGYLAGKALAAALAGDRDKALHHCISSAAALANWHAALLGANTRMRPGIETPAEEPAA